MEETEKKENYLDELEVLKKEANNIVERAKLDLKKIVWVNILSWYKESKADYWNYFDMDLYRTWNIFRTIFMHFVSLCSNLFQNTIYYSLFILPLLTLVLIFVPILINPNHLEQLNNLTWNTINLDIYWLWELIKNNAVNLEELTLNDKIIFCIPFLWMSWFGQRTIFQRKRLYEEYNHKMQVTNMYLNFTAYWNDYKIDKNTMVELNELFIDTVGKNPMNIYWNSETFLDKLVELYSKRKGNKKEISEEKIKEKEIYDKYDYE